MNRRSFIGRVLAAIGAGLGLKRKPITPLPVHDNHLRQWGSAVSPLGPESFGCIAEIECDDGTKRLVAATPTTVRVEGEGGSMPIADFSDWIDCNGRIKSQCLT